MRRSNAFPGALALLLAISGCYTVTANIPPIWCDGKEVPFTPGRYIVQMKGQLSREELNQVAGWTSGQANTSDDYFQLYSVLSTISAFSAQFSYHAVKDFVADYGDQIDMFECDSMVAAVSTRLYCRTNMLKEPLPGNAEYTVNVKDSKAMDAVKAHLGDLEAIEYKDAEPSATGSPQFTAKLNAEQIGDLFASRAGDDVNFLQCTIASIARVPLVENSNAPAEGAELEDSAPLDKGAAPAVAEGASTDEQQDEQKPSVVVPLVMCNGKEVPFTAGRYIVQMKGGPSKQELNQIAGWTSAQVEKDDDYFQLHNVLSLIGAFSAEFSYHAIKDFVGEYGDRINLLECDSMVAAISTRLYCRATTLEEPLPGNAEYTVNVKDTKALQAVKAQLGDLEVIEYQDAEPSQSGSPQFTAKLNAEQINDLLASPSGDDVNFLQCTTASIARVPLVPAKDVPVEEGTATVEEDMIPATQDADLAVVEDMAAIPVTISADEQNNEQKPPSGVPPVMCNGKEVPFTAGRYIVQMNGSPTREELNQIAGWTNAQVEKDGDYFQLHNVMSMIGAFSAQFSYHAMKDFVAQYGDQIDLVECDSMVYAISTRLYCRTIMLEKPLPGNAEYIVNVKDSQALKAVKAQLGDLEAIEYKDAELSPAGSPQFTAELNAAQVEDLLASPAGDDVNFLQCTTEYIARSPQAQEAGDAAKDAEDGTMLSLGAEAGTKAEEQPKDLGAQPPVVAKPFAIDGNFTDADDDDSSAIRLSVALAFIVMGFSMIFSIIF